MRATRELRVSLVLVVARVRARRDKVAAICKGARVAYRRAISRGCSAVDRSNARGLSVGVRHDAGDGASATGVVRRFNARCF